MGIFLSQFRFGSPFTSDPFFNSLIIIAYLYPFKTIQHGHFHRIHGSQHLTCYIPVSQRLFVVPISIFRFNAPIRSDEDTAKSIFFQSVIITAIHIRQQCPRLRHFLPALFHILLSTRYVLLLEFTNFLCSAVQILFALSQILLCLIQTAKTLILRTGKTIHRSFTLGPRAKYSLFFPFFYRIIFFCRHFLSPTGLSPFSIPLMIRTTFPRKCNQLRL